MSEIYYSQGFHITSYSSVWDASLYFKHFQHFKGNPSPFTNCLYYSSIAPQNLSLYLSSHFLSSINDKKSVYLAHSHSVKGVLFCFVFTTTKGVLIQCIKHKKQQLHLIKSYKVTTLPKDNDIPQN